MRTALAATALLMLALAVPSFAGQPLTVFNSGQPWLWPDGGQNIPFNPDQGGLGSLNNAAAVALVEEAFEKWENVATSSASYTNAGLLPVDVDDSNFFPWVFPAAPDGLSAVVLDEDGAIFDALFGPGSGVLGFSSPEWGVPFTGEITEGVAFLNGKLLGAGLIVLDTQLGIAVHELGHFSNLGHSVVNGEIAAFLDQSGPTPFDTFPLEDLFQRVETMYPFSLILADGTDFIGSSTPHADDISTISTLYPAPGFHANGGSIRGTILATDGAFKVTGVNVIARNVADPYDDARSNISSSLSPFLSQLDAFTGAYEINGLTPGADYAVFVDGLLAGDFSVPPLFPLPGDEELYNGANESADPTTDDASVFTPVASVAGTPTTGIDIIFNRLGPGEPLPLGDDDNFELFMPFGFDFCGTEYTTLFVNSNGSITFGGGDNDFSESASDMLGDLPRIAPFWHDLNPSGGGIIQFAQSSNTFTVFWNAVPQFPATGANTFSVTLHRSSGQINLNWDALSASDGLAGISCGGDVTIGNEPSVDLSDLGSSGTIKGRISPAIYELWHTNSPNDVADSHIDITAPKGFVDKNEPNDALADATKVRLPFSSGDQAGGSPNLMYTDINTEGADVDYYEFNAPAGVTLLAQTTTGPDTLIGLFDAVTGELLDSNDDGGAGVLSRIQFPLSIAGDYVIAVTTFADFDFSGDGNSSGRYVLEIDTVEGILLDLGDDASALVPIGFSFPFQGFNWTEVYVNSNGNLTFGAASTDFSETVGDLLSGPPRIAALWDDLSPNNGGQVRVESGASSMTVLFDSVPEFFGTGSNTFAVTLHDDGTIEFVYGGVTALDGLVGITQGGGATDPGETDLSAAGTLSATGTTYENFSTGDNDLSGSSLQFR